MKKSETHAFSQSSGYNRDYPMDSTGAEKCPVYT
jgi:hypothetical protein